MHYEQSTIISKRAMEDANYDAVKYAKLSMTRAFLEQIVESETSRVGIDIEFEEWWHPVRHYAPHEELEYRIKAIVHVKEWKQ
jgi:hypothetical protein